MKKLIILSIVCIAILSACNNIFKPDNGDEPNGDVQSETMQREQQPQKSINRSLNGVGYPKNNSTNPYALEENTKIKYNGKILMLHSLEGEVKEQLERENAGMDFKVIIEAQDDNTQ